MSANDKAIGSAVPIPGIPVAASKESAAFVPFISAKRGMAAIYEGLAKQVEKPE